MKLLSFLLKNYQVFAPQEEDGQIFISERSEETKFLRSKVFIKELKDPKEAVLDNGPPFYSWKKFFVPECESLFDYQSIDLKRPLLGKDKQTVLFGLNILDLKSILLYDQVFAKDPYYQERRKELLIVANDLVPEAEHNLTHRQYDRAILENLPFDIFLEAKNGSNIFAGSEKGQEILKKAGQKKFETISFKAPLREDVSGSKLNVVRDKLRNHHNSKIWEELGKICLACGKCTLVCPTCFCFRIDDQAELKESEGTRNRCWDSCFYEEFSEVGGGHKFLKTPAEKIHFWYYHKFVRIPDEFGITGCVGCHRCHQVCPVGIDIKEILKQIENS